MFFIVVAAAICGLDQLLKCWITANIGLGESVAFIPGVLSLTHVRNTGMAFSMLSEHTWLLAAFSVIVVIALAVIILRKKLTFWENFGIAMIMGGAIGNAIDRISLGYVVDMFQVDFVNFAVFNLADAFINVGAILFVILYLIRSVKEDKQKHGDMPELERLKKNISGDTENLDTFDERKPEDSEKVVESESSEKSEADETSEATEKQEQKTGAPKEEDSDDPDNSN